MIKENGTNKGAGRRGSYVCQHDLSEPRAQEHGGKNSINQVVRYHTEVSRPSISLLPIQSLKEDHQKQPRDVPCSTSRDGMERWGVSSRPSVPERVLQNLGQARRRNRERT